MEKHWRTLSIATLQIVLFAVAGCASGKAAAPAVQSAGPTQAEMTKYDYESTISLYRQQLASGTVDYPELTKRFTSLTTRDPSNYEALYNLGVLQEKQGLNDAAIASYKASAGSVKEAAENLGNLYRRTERIQEAVEVFKGLQEKYPADLKVKAALASLYRQQGKYDQAIELCRAILLDNPRNLEAYRTLSMIYFDQNKYELARLNCVQGLKIDENDPGLRHIMGMVLMKLNDMPVAFAQFRKVLEMRPDYLPARMNIGAIELQYTDYNGAAKEFLDVLKVEPNNIDAHLSLGVAYRGKREFEKSREQYQIVIGLDPSNKLGKKAAALFNMGILYHKGMDRPDEAINYYRQYIELGQGKLPKDAPVFALLKEAQEQSNMNDEIKDKQERQKLAYDVYSPVLLKSAEDAYGRITGAFLAGAARKAASEIVPRELRSQQKEVREEVIKDVSAKVAKSLQADLDAKSKAERIGLAKDTAESELLDIAFTAPNKSEIKARVSAALQPAVDKAYNNQMNELGKLDGFRELVAKKVSEGIPESLRKVQADRGAKSVRDKADREALEKADREKAAKEKAAAPAPAPAAGAKN